MEKFEFLYTDNKEKLVPVQLLKTNYGITEEQPNLRQEVASIGQSRPIDMIFPYDSSNIVFLVDKTNNLIKSTKAAPPGITNITVEVEAGISYWIYVVSKEYDDGYVGQEYNVDPEITSGSRLVVTFDGIVQTIDLSPEGRMEPSLDYDQWYNWQGVYESNDLIWSVPFEGVTVDSENYWLVIRQEILGQIDNIFRQNDLNTFNLNNKLDPIKVFRITDDLAELMRDKKEEYETILGENAYRLDDIWDFINSTLFGYGFDGNNQNSLYYVSYTDEIGDLVDEFGVYADYIRWDLLNQGGYQPDANAYRAGQYVAATNEGRPATITYNDDDGNSRTFNCLMDDDERYKGFYEGGIGARTLIEGMWEGIPWTRATSGGQPGEGHPAHGIFDPRFKTQWNRFRGIKEDYIYATNDLLHEQYGLPLFPANVDGFNLQINQQWWSGVANIAQTWWDNFTEWLTEAKNENLVAMSIAGDTMFDGVPGEGEQFVQSRPIVYDIVPEQSDVQYPEIIESTRVMDRISFTWAIPSGYSVQIAHANSLDEVLNVNNVGGTIAPFIFSYSLSENIDNTLPYYFRLRATQDGFTYSNDLVFHFMSMVAGEEEVETPPGDSGDGSGDVQNTAQLAILQNIRFLKNMLTASNENIWSTLNNTIFMLMDKVNTIEQAVGFNQQKTSIVNITNASVDDEDVQILHSNIYQGYEFRPLDIAMRSIGDAKLLNLNSKEIFSVPGKHLLSVQPRKLSIRISERDANVILVPDDLNAYTNDNHFYGWNIQFETLDGRLLGSQKTIVGSFLNQNGTHLKVSPFIDGSIIPTDEQIRAKVWSNLFIPVLIQVDIVEHTNKTLSYSLYSTKEVNRDTGIMTIYDYAGNVYKQLTVGTYSNASSDGSIIEYRSPVPNVNDSTFDASDGLSQEITPDGPPAPDPTPPPPGRPEPDFES